MRSAAPATLLVALACAGFGAIDRKAFDKTLIDGNYVEAEAIARRMLADLESRSKESPDVADALNLLVEVHLYGEKFNSPEVDTLAERAIALHQRFNGADAPRVATSLRLYSNVLTQRGDYQKARPLYERALGIFSRQSAPNSFQFAETWNAYSILLVKMGNYREAKYGYEQALAIRNTRFAGGGAVDGFILNGLSIAQRMLGNLEGSRASAERALALVEKRFGERHPQTADFVEDLGTVLQQMGDTARARALFERTLALREQAGWANHPGIASALSHLADLYAATGEREKARESFARALPIMEATYGIHHPALAEIESARAVFFARGGETQAALAAAARSESVGRAHLRLQIRTLPEQQALAYASGRASGLDTMLALAADPAADTRLRDEIARTAFDALIRSRAIVFDELAARRHALAGRPDPDIADETARWNAARERLSSLVARKPDDLTPAAYSEALRQARDRMESAERELAQKSVAVRRDLASSRAGLAEIAAGLPAGSAMVSYSLYARHQPGARAILGVGPSRAEQSYIAFFMRAGEPQPIAAPLGSAAEIDALVAEVHRQVSLEALAPDHAPKRSEAAYRTAADKLRSRIWDPLAQRVGVERVFIVPDGALHLVNFGALPVGTGEYLMERGPLLHYLSAERDLIAPAPAANGRGLLALGNPAFGARQKLPSNAIPGTGCAGPAHFRPLPASGAEVERLTALWRRVNADEPAIVLSGDRAGSAAVKSAGGKRVLHLATHAFFTGGGCGDPAIVVSPLLRSGLALAGANRPSAAGILSAEEIAAMHLEGLEWAVLSACDTGRGEWRPGEGVFGLRRAFQIAGARTVVMSLWAVEDDAARRWMETLYRERFARASPTAESVRNASLAVLKWRRAGGRSGHPFYWAGFIAAGDWR